MNQEYYKYNNKTTVGNQIQQVLMQPQKQFDEMMTRERANSMNPSGINPKNLKIQKIQSQGI